MLFSVNKNQTLALSGLFQAAQLVTHLARKTDYNQHALQESALSVLKIEAENVDDVYSGGHGMSLGLRTIIHCFGQQPRPDSRDIYQYVISMHALSVKLRKLPMMANEIAERLQLLQKDYLPYQGTDDWQEDEAFFVAIADVYTQTLSKLSPRIIVQGDTANLNNQQVVNRIRAALFAGIRSGYLWHQLGGRRMHIMFGRKAYVKIANQILTRQHRV